MIRLRLAQPADAPALRELIPAAVRSLSREHYTPQQIESAIRHVFGVDTQLILDGTYFIAEDDGGAIIGCGGWSRRRTLYGGDQMKAPPTPDTPDDPLDPATGAARVRAFFVAPGWARRGVASRIMRACLDAALAAGFARLELAATLPGTAFYRVWGFADNERLDTTLPDGTEIAFVRMSYKLDALPTVRPSA